MEVKGAVKFPGTYPADGNQTVAQMIDAAGGFVTSSYKGVAEIISKTVDSSGEVIFTQKEVDLLNNMDQIIQPETELNIKQIKILFF